MVHDVYINYKQIYIYFKQIWGLEAQASSAETFCSDCHSVSVTFRQEAGSHRLRAPALATESWFCVKGCAKLLLPANFKEGRFSPVLVGDGQCIVRTSMIQETLKRQLANFTSRTVLVLCCFSYPHEVLDPFINILFFLKTNMLIFASEVWGKKQTEMPSQ